jgi:uncharacterized protein YqeY
MNNIEFISFIDECIKTEMLLGPNKNEKRLIGLRNIKSDFNYISSREPKIDTIDILKRLYKERRENENIYKDANKLDLWLQERTEAEILSRWIPKEPDRETVFLFLNTLSDITRQKSSFKKYQAACIKHFGQKIDSSIILDFINEN